MTVFSFRLQNRLTALHSTRVDFDVYFQYLFDYPPLSDKLIEQKKVEHLKCLILGSYFCQIDEKKSMNSSSNNCESLKEPNKQKISVDIMQRKIK